MARILDAYAAHLDALNLRPATIRGYIDRLRVISTTVDPTDLTPATLRAFCDARGHAPGTARLYFSTVRLFTRWAHREGITTADAFAEARAPRRVRYPSRPAPVADLAAIIAADEQPWADMVALAAFGGLRASEIAAFRGDHVRPDTDSPVLLIPEGKGGVPGSVPAHPRIVAIARKNHGRHFPDMTGADVSDSCSRYFRRRGYGCTLHGFRHLFATRLYASTRDILLVSRALRHADVSVTAGYILDDSRALDDAISRLT